MADLPIVSASRYEDEGVPEFDRNTDYFITISTNKRPSNDADAEALVNDLTQASEFVWTDRDSLARIIKFNKVGSGVPNPAPPWHSLSSSPRVIQSISMRHAPEVGQNKYGGRVHDHIELRIVHGSNITIKNSLPEIKESYFATGLLDRWGVDNLYVKISLIRDPYKAHQVYLRKGAGRYRLRPPTTERRFIPYQPGGGRGRGRGGGRGGGGGVGR